MRCLYILEINPIISPILWVVLLFMVSFAVQKLLSLIRCHLKIFVFILITLGGGSRRYCCDLWHSVLPVFSSQSFLVSRLTFGALIYFDYICVCGFKDCSNLFLLLVAVQFSRHHILRRKRKILNKRLRIEDWKTAMQTLTKENLGSFTNKGHIT